MARRIGGRYRLVDQLGAGGMSVVWRAFDEVLQRPVAVKVLDGEDPELRDAIRREAQAAARLCHPHIANVYDYGESTLDGAYVVMELVVGDSLSTLLAGGATLPWRQAVGICAQVASALSEAHAHGLVHRDVKPGNVMIGRSGAKVVDFGISALVGELDRAADGRLLGTPAYVAPERLAGGRAETASDVYAVGVLLHRALTGRLPWDVETAQELLAAHRDADPPVLRDLEELADVPADVLAACQACLSKDPAARPRSDDLAKTLGDAADVPVSFPSPVGAYLVGPTGPATDRFVVEDPTPLPRTSSLPLGPRFAVTRTRMALGVVGALVLLAAAAAWGGAPTPEPVSTAWHPPLPPPVPTRCSVRYDVQQDWNTGFAAVVTVTNAGAAALRGATLRFEFPGKQTVVKSGPWRQSGKEVTVELAKLGPGRSVRLPLTARYRSENPLPLAFTVGEASCATLVTGPKATYVAEQAGDGGGHGHGGKGKDKHGPSEEGRA